MASSIWVKKSKSDSKNKNDKLTFPAISTLYMYCYSCVCGYFSLQSIWKKNQTWCTSLNFVGIGERNKVYETTQGQKKTIILSNVHMCAYIYIHLFKKDL